PTEQQEPVVVARGKLLIFNNVTEPLKVKVYDVKGVLLKTIEQTEDGASIVISDNHKLLFVNMTSKSGNVRTLKIIK
ncbi:MAG: hypothetical protein ACK5KP_06550, partial [Paludibacteraceae bacterium]